MVYDRLVGLDYLSRRTQEPRTDCTDFDFAWLLWRLAHQLPDKMPEVIDICRRLAEMDHAQPPVMDTTNPR